MYSKLSVFLLCLGIGQIAASTVKLSAKHLLQLSVTHHVKIQRLQRESEVLAEVHQETSKSCFNYYTPILNTISIQYEINYDSCISSYANASDVIDAKYEPARQEFKNEITGSCKTLSSCNVNSTQANNSFACIADNASEISKSFYSISVNATDIAAKIEEDYRVIDTEKEICVNHAEWSYVENTADTYEKLNACLRGEIDFTTPDTTPIITDPDPTTIVPSIPDYTSTTVW